jgi:hypothetical protein
MKAFVAVCLIAMAALAVGRSGPAPRPRITMPPAPSARPLTGEPPSCSGGCSQVVPERPWISDAQVRTLLARIESDPTALTECLFYGDSVSRVLEADGTYDLPTLQRSILRRELARRFVRVEFKMRDDDGTLDVRLSKVYRLGEKRRHVADAAVGVQEPRLSLILQRVDVDRLWSRI